MFRVTPGMRRLGSGVLAFEAVVVVLTIPVAVTGGVDTLLAVGVGAGLAVACVVVAGLLKWPFGVVAGSVLQVLVIATGFLVPTMFFLGAIFAALWITAIFVARRVEGVTFR